MARNAAAGPPSTARWSKVRHACIVGRTAIRPSDVTIGRSRIRPIQRIPTCGGLRIAVVMSTGWMPPFETVNVAAFQIVRGQRAIARTSGELGDLRVDLLERELVGASHDGRDQAFVGLDGDRDVDLLEQLDRVLGDARVEPRMFTERSGHDLHDDCRDADARCGAPAVQPGAQLDERRHVELEHGSQLGGGLQAGDHASGDRAAPPAQRDRPRDRERVPRGGRRRCVAAGSPGGDVAVEDATAGPGAGDVARVVEREAELLEQGPCTRRDERGAARSGLGGGRRSRRRRPDGAGDLGDGRSPTLVDVAEERMPTVSSLRVGRTPGCEGVVLGTCLRDQCDRRADWDRLPGRDEAMNPAGGLGLDLRVRLVGLELEDDAAELDLLALVDEPLREQDVLGVRAELGHDHRDCGHGLRSAARVGRVTGRGRA